MNDYHDIAQLYKAYCSVPADQYWYILTLHSRPEEYKKLRRILFPPKISEDEIKRREALLYLYLWDLLFYNKYPYNEEYLWRDANHKKTILREVNTLLINPSDDLQEIILTLCEHCPILNLALWFSEAGIQEPTLDYVNETESYNNCTTSPEKNTDIVVQTLARRQKKLYTTYIARFAKMTSDNILQKTSEIANTYKIGDRYITDDGVQGIVFWVDETSRHGKIVSMRQGSLKWCDPDIQQQDWSLKGSSKVDGQKNTHQVLEGATKGQFPAFLWCKTLGKNWYLPSMMEMKAILQNDCVMNAIKVYGIPTSPLKEYWTSSEIDSKFAYMVSNKIGFEKSAKEVSALVRAVYIF